LGNALRFILSCGQTSDHRQAGNLIADFEFNYLIADKGYDSQAFVELVSQTGAEAVIPSRSWNRCQREIDWHLYRERHLIECFIGKIKHYRRIFTRFEKLSKNYLSFIHLVSSLIWLK
jgi:transposase